jgi:hypothetical protein
VRRWICVADVRNRSDCGCAQEFPFSVCICICPVPLSMSINLFIFVGLRCAAFSALTLAYFFSHSVPAPYHASTPISPGFYSSPVHPTYPMSASRSPGGYPMSMSNLSLLSLPGYYPSSPSGSRRGYPVM